MSIRSTTRPTVMLALLLALVAAPAALAHARLLRSDPADGAQLAQSPPLLHLGFSEAATLAQLVLRAEGHGGDHRMAPLPDSAARELVVRMPELPPGRYELAWRVLAEDRHISSGTLHFTILGPAGSVH